MAIAYVLINETLREVYNGATSRSFMERVTEHANGRTKSVKHWDFDRDRIRYRTKRYRSLKAASRAAHAADDRTACCVGNRRKKKKNWCNRCTGGI